MHSLNDWKPNFGKGWHRLLEIAGKNLPTGAIVINVERRYGGLRVNLLKPSPREAREMRDVEEISYNTCETCGGWDDVIQVGPKGGTLRSACGKCREESK